MKRILRVNTKTRKVESAPEGQRFFRMGGRSITSHIISTEVDPATDPLGPGNKLIIAGMLLAGTPLSTSNRLSVGCKSPLTGGIKEANVGGTAGAYLAGQGIKAIVLEDRPDAAECNILVIAPDGEAKIEEAPYLKELGTYDTEKLLREKFGDKISIMCIGPAGERLYRNSSIMVSEQGNNIPCRAAGRGGVGAVMGSKGIKAVVIHQAKGQYKFPYANQEAFLSAAKKVTASMLENRATFAQGTVVNLMATIPMAIAPYRNFNGDKMTDEEQAKFNARVVIERIGSYGGKIGHACQPGCVIRCSNSVNDEHGEFITAGFEYETVELAGPNCGIFDVEPIFRFDRFCDDFGFDSIELGTSVGVYMESGRLKWGDADGMLEMLGTFWEGGELADDFGSGTERLGKKLGVKHIPTVKGQAMAAYEPRNVKGTGTTYAISTMGADHTCGSSLGNPDLVPTKKAGQLEFAVAAQAMMATVDCLMCLFAWKGAASAMADFLGAISAAFGEVWTPQELFKMGGIAVMQERKFNLAAGIGFDQDKLPDFFYKEASPATGAVYDITSEEIAEKWQKQA